MSNLPNLLKVFIFSINSPWGVIRKADGTLQYKHIMGFESQDKQDEFIKNELLTNEQQTNIRGNNWRSLVDEKEEVGFDYLSDTRIHIRVPQSKTGMPLNQIYKSDFMVVKLNGEYQFYALKVLEVKLGGLLLLEGELDIFFTYLKTGNDTPFFREQSSNFIIRGHCDRVEKLNDYTNAAGQLIPNTETSSAFRFKHFLNIPHWYNNDEPQFANLPKTSHYPLTKKQSENQKAQESVGWLVMYQSQRGEIK